MLKSDESGTEEEFSISVSAITAAVKQGSRRGGGNQQERGEIEG